MMVDRGRIVDRVRKLLAYRAENASRAEVEAAMRLAAKLMQEYAIEQGEAMVAPETLRDAYTVAVGARLATWELTLCEAVAAAVPGASFGRMGPEDRGGDVKVLWFGPVELVRLAADMFAEFRGTIATMAVGLYGGVYRGRGRSYAQGFADALQGLSHPTDEVDCRALAATAHAENWRWLQREYNVGVRRRRMRTRDLDADAYFDGQEDGHRHELRRRQTTRLADEPTHALPGEEGA